MYIGENAEDNENIIINANEEDLWFHVSENPSPHVLAIIHNNCYDRKSLRYIAIQAALLCKQYSKYKSEKNVKIIYTKIKNVILTDKLGTVKTCNTKHIFI
jgi:predicted ribosome quality control (RQC) complex YloA/Tae2 family protein